MKKRFVSNLAGLLLVALASSMPAVSRATEFVTDMFLVGGETYAEVHATINSYLTKGWKLVDYDLNKGCGNNSDYIYLLYKTDHYNDGLNHHYITDLIIVEGSKYYDRFTEDGVLWILVPYGGSSHFVEMKGDLNSNAGGKYIHLYYTRHDNGVAYSITDIWADSNKTSAVGNGFDLNKGAGGDYIYLHFDTDCYYHTDEGITYDLSTVDKEIRLGCKDRITGKLTNPAAAIHILAETKVVIDNVEIDIRSDDFENGIRCEGDAEIFFTGVNKICGGYEGSAGIRGHRSITLSGDGVLMAYGGTGESGEGRAPGIQTPGDIVINSGEIIAEGGRGAAAIGGAENGSCGKICVGNGITKVVATAGEDAPNAIGAGKNGIGGEVTYDDFLQVVKEGRTWTVKPKDPVGIKEIKNEELRMKNEE